MASLAGTLVVDIKKGSLPVLPPGVPVYVSCKVGDHEYRTETETSSEKMKWENSEFVFKVKPGMSLMTTIQVFYEQNGQIFLAAVASVDLVNTVTPNKYSQEAVFTVFHPTTQQTGGTIKTKLVFEPSAGAAAPPPSAVVLPPGAMVVQPGAMVVQPGTPVMVVQDPNQAAAQQAEMRRQEEDRRRREEDERRRREEEERRRRMAKGVAVGAVVGAGGGMMRGAMVGAAVGAPVAGMMVGRRRGAVRGAVIGGALAR
eukprot:CAMPEP_0184661228 /NCGR_PEP_ID=MMETSP0308-20130426/37504_1 /TAXON_ID=38269 /ORGANISM="Gloeochaete witrockiana, Strain SAG 46.84" /LENGTH=256 /DNA_ID=CAMNT_0027102371 /DNA_START=44 /DNA_END=814 /DNA_ORIENTATION=+